MLVDIDDIIVNDVDMALDELLDIYLLKIDRLEDELRNWRDKVKNYGVKKGSAKSKPSKTIVKVYPRELLKRGYTISDIDGLRRYTSHKIQFGGMLQEELRDSTIAYITSILRCDDEELLENISDIKASCPCRDLHLVWNDIKKYLDLRIRFIKLKNLRNDLTIGDSKGNCHQKVLSKQKPEAL